MFRKKNDAKNTYGIVGLGRFGMALAIELSRAAAELIVLDRDEEKIREMREYTENAFITPTLDKKTLLETGIQNCDVAVVCTSTHMDTSILTTLHLVSMGIPTVMAKATSAEHGEILQKLGAQVVYPERDMAVRLAHRLEANRMLDYIQLSEKLNISKLLVPQQLVGQTVLEADLRRRFGANIIAIETPKELLELVSPEYVFEKGDILFLSGRKDNLQKLGQLDR